MHIKDFDKVGSLMKERSYLLCLVVMAEDKTLALRIGPQDIRTDIATIVRPAVVAAVRSELSRNTGDLVALGVAVDKGEGVA